MGASPPRSSPHRHHGALLVVPLVTTYPKSRFALPHARYLHFLDCGGTPPLCLPAAHRLRANSPRPIAPHLQNPSGLLSLSDSWLLPSSSPKHRPSASPSHS